MAVNTRRGLEYVVYANGIKHKDHMEDDDPALEPGEDITPDHFATEDEGRYHVEHGNIVRKGGPHDPNVLQANIEAATAQPAEDEDPRDARIRALEAQLDMLTGRPGTPAPGMQDPEMTGDVYDDDDVEDDEPIEPADDDEQEVGTAGSSGSPVADPTL